MCPLLTHERRDEVTIGFGDWIRRERLDSNSFTLDFLFLRKW